ncbi:hypothetical protein Mbo2_111 [Rhodococcus phage Mbo2]|uniref:Uncharacterized protein n=1 Tax=Rhodococcus phage Mbo2 TaxID=2936911 RepID=A0A9E7IMG5_9CAUD|nr:hypothetical protein Mbo2_111 [Rhodococcus phage Mbo2]
MDLTDKPGFRGTPEAKRETPAVVPGNGVANGMIVRRDHYKDAMRRLEETITLLGNNFLTREQATAMLMDDAQRLRNLGTDKSGSEIR